MEFGRGVEVLSSQNLTFCILPNLSIMLRFGEYGGRNKRLIPSSAALSLLPDNADNGHCREQWRPEYHQRRALPFEEMSLSARHPHKP